MAMTRRKFMTGAALGAGAALGPKHAWAQQPGLGRDRLVLLGTKGGPRITGYAPTPSSNLIVYRNVPYVIDAGYGVTFKLRSEEHTSELQSLAYLVCRLLLEKKKK